MHSSLRRTGRTERRRLPSLSDQGYQGAANATNPFRGKAAIGMLPARPPKDDEPRRPDEDFLTPKSLILLIIAGGVADLYIHSPHVGVAVVAAITVLALLRKII